MITVLNDWNGIFLTSINKECSLKHQNLNLQFRISPALGHKMDDLSTNVKQMGGGIISFLRKFFQSLFLLATVGFPATLWHFSRRVRAKIPDTQRTTETWPRRRH